MRPVSSPCRTTGSVFRLNRFMISAAPATVKRSGIALTGAIMMSRASRTGRTRALRRRSSSSLTSRSGRGRGGLEGATQLVLDLGGRRVPDGGGGGGPVPAPAEGGGDAPHVHRLQPAAGHQVNPVVHPDQNEEDIDVLD